MVIKRRGERPHIRLSSIETDHWDKWQTGDLWARTRWVQLRQAAELLASRLSIARQCEVPVLGYDGRERHSVDLSALTLYAGGAHA